MRARIIMLCAMLLCLISSVQAADSPDRGRRLSFSLPASNCTATINAPERIVLGSNKLIPFSVDIKTPSGEPFTSDKYGQLNICTRYGAVTVDGERWDSRLYDVGVSNGRIEATLELNRTTVTDDLYIAVLGGEYPNLDLLGVVWLEVLYADSYEILYDQSRLTARAGSSQPACVRLVAYDQYKRPLPGVRVRGMFHNPAYDDEDIWVETDSDGIAALLLPMRPKEEYESVQMLIGGHIPTKQIWIQYSQDAEPPMSPLRDGVFLAGGVLNWNQTTRTATAKCPGFVLTVRDGDSYATVNGVRVPLDRPAMVRDGRIHLPVSFLRQRLGLNA